MLQRNEMDVFKDRSNPVLQMFYNKDKLLSKIFGAVSVSQRVTWNRIVYL